MAAGPSLRKNSWAVTERRREISSWKRLSWAARRSASCNSSRPVSCSTSSARARTTVSGEGAVSTPGARRGPAAGGPASAHSSSARGSTRPSASLSAWRMRAGPQRSSTMLPSAGMPTGAARSPRSRNRTGRWRNWVALFSVLATSAPVTPEPGRSGLMRTRSTLASRTVLSTWKLDSTDSSSHPSFLTSGSRMARPSGVVSASSRRRGDSPISGPAARRRARRRARPGGGRRTPSRPAGARALPCRAAVGDPAAGRSRRRPARADPPW